MVEPTMTRTKIDTIPDKTIIVAKGDGFKDVDNLKDALELANELGASINNPVGIEIYSGAYTENNHQPRSVPIDGSIKVNGRGSVSISPMYTDRRLFDHLFPYVEGCRITEYFDGNEQIYGISCRSPTSVSLCSITREREETWRKLAEDVWIMSDVSPSYHIQDPFMVGEVLAPTILGLQSFIPWTVNGRRGGAVDPNENNFIAANQLGGGLLLRVLAGGNDDDYTAIHFNGNYPIGLSLYPQICVTVDFEENSDIAYFAGLVDDSKSTGTNAFGLPDNCLGFYLDTDSGDAHVRCIIRQGGNYILNQDIGPAPDGSSFGCIRRNVMTGYIEFILLNQIVATYTGDDFPTEQLQPYAATVARAAALAENVDMTIQLMNLIMDNIE